MFKEKEDLKGPKKAILYCRVSSSKQREEGHGLDSQEHRCRQYAALRGYHIEKVFPDDVSGGCDFMERPGMAALLDYLDEHDDENFVIIFDDLKRLARHRDVHFKLRHALSMRNAEVECLNFRFEDTPEGEFVETIFAAQGQLERLQNARQTKQRMRARVEKGYYIFGAPPLGYEYVPLEDGGKILAPVEPNASIMREVFEGLASGRFKTAVEVQNFLDRFPSTARPNKRNGLHLQSVHNHLKSPLYAGYMTIPKWGIHLQPAKHEPLVSFETWKKAQDRLDEKAKTVFRKDINRDFPLRGFLVCASCGNTLTAAWSKGRSSYYPYYFCQKKGCSQRNKNIRKEKIEGEFEALLKKLQPAPGLIAMAYAMMEDRWNTVMQSIKSEAVDTKAAMAKLDQKTAQLVDLLLDANSPALIKAYEGRIKKLEEEKAQMAEQASQSKRPRHSFRHTYRTACAFLINPCKLWNSGVFEQQRLLVRMVFPGRIEYCRNEGYRTAAIAEPFRLLGTLAGSRSEMVGPAGLEPATRPL